jgi:hypothetical protein
MYVVTGEKYEHNKGDFHAIYPDYLISIVVESLSLTGQDLKLMSPRLFSISSRDPK